MGTDLSVSLAERVSRTMRPDGPFIASVPHAAGSYGHCLIQLSLA